MPRPALFVPALFVPALFVSVALAALVAACKAPQQPEPQPAALAQRPASPAAQPLGPITGGYAPSDIDNPDIEAARDLAVAEIYKQFPTRALVENVTAEVQVVAGLNYRFMIRMSGEALLTYEAVVYRDLQKQMRVTSLKKVG